MSKTDLTYQPDYAIAPGEILEETLAARGIRKSDLAERCGFSAKTMSLIIGGKAPVIPETAIQFERVLGISASIWNNLEARYRLFLAQQSELEQLGQRDDWLQRFPIKELEKRGIIKKSGDVADRVAHLLDFLGVGSISAWQEKHNRLQVAFRRSPSFGSAPEAVATWLRLGELKAAETKCAPFDKGRLDVALQEIRGLSCADPKVFEPRMKELCARSGVALVFVGELPGTHLSGATQWLRPDKAMIELSLRHKTDDYLWFTFFHEVGHILLHGKRATFIDEGKLSVVGEEEQQANQFAADRLMPKAAYARFLQKEDFSASSVKEFAEQMGIAPGILVGRLQYDGIVPWPTSLNHLKCHFKLVESSE